MSTERLSFGFNSLIPETYKSKAEAFAKCLQHKLLSLGGVDASSSTYNSDSNKRLNDQLEGEIGGCISCTKPGYTTQNFQNKDGNSNGKQNGGLSEQSIKEGKMVESSLGETSRKFEKTDISDEEFFSHSESENSDLTEHKIKSEAKLIDRTKQKLITMSSEDSTVDSWCSCQDNLNDFDKCDSENEEVNLFASQIKGSPKLRNWNLRSKRKEIREKSWKKNSKKNYSSSTESMDSEGVYSSQGLKQKLNNPTENSDSHGQFILLDGLDLEDDEVPYRILRESSSTSSLEKHFSRSCSEETSELGSWNRRLKNERNIKDAPDSNSNLIGNERNALNNSEGGETTAQKAASKADQKMSEIDATTQSLMTRLNFADISTEVAEPEETNSMKDFTINDISKSVYKVGGRIVECPCDNNIRTELDNTDDGIYTNCQVLVTSIEVLSDKSEDQITEAEKSEDEKTSIMVPQEDWKETGDESKPPEDDDLLDSRSKLRRCSSLKTWKTPPGTPGAKKIVRFADALGLDLADVRTYLDEIPKVPSSAYEDLHFDIPPYAEPLPPLEPMTTLIPLFQQPGSKMDFLERVQTQKICLETALVTETTVLTVTGYVRVQNMSFHKSVHVRYSLNNWETFSDLQATYVPNSCDGFSDKFSFILYGHTLKIGQQLQFALRLECSGTQYWDNNGGINYVFNCLPQSSANSFFSSLHASPVEPWHDFY